MAIFYNHIKGCGKNTTGTTNNLDQSATKTSVGEAWSWIKWADTLTYTKNPSADLAYVENNPYIYLNNANLTNSTPEDSPLSLGRIITSRSKEQCIHTSFNFKSTLQIDNSTTIKNSLFITGEGTNKASVIGQNKQHDIAFINQSKLYLFKTVTPDCSKTPNQWGNYCSISTDIYSDAPWLVIGCDKSDGSHGGIYMGISDLTIENKQQDGTDKGANLRLSGDAFISNKCEALYFNATSDRRAKSNITPAEFSALDIIKQLPIYTFNYLNDPKLSVGLIAQEAAEYNLDGFNMVDNLDASGEFGDFMQMKESKLVYVLWKAVQELSAEVEELKAEIASLK